MNRNKVPANAVLAQTVIASVATAIIYFPIQSASSNYSTKVSPGAAGRGNGGVVHVDGAALWRRVLCPAFVPREIQEVQRTPWAVLAVCGVVGIAADVAAVFLLFWAPWAPIFTKAGWGLAVGAIAVVVDRRRARDLPHLGTRPREGAPPRGDTSGDWKYKP
mgnify:CR=1 FL=1